MLVSTKDFNIKNFKYKILYFNLKINNSLVEHNAEIFDLLTEWKKFRLAPKAILMNGSF